MNKHSFALFLQNLEQLINGRELALVDADIQKRIATVLRLGVGEKIIFFDRKRHVVCALLIQEKRRLIFSIEEIFENDTLEPNIILFLPLLKREAFETALYSAVELGANRIIPYYTEKSHRKELSLKEQERAEKIMISAAEQSKYFAFPHLEPICSLAEMGNLSAKKIFFDPEGERAAEVIARLNAIKEVALIVGPEADLTTGEKLLLKSQQVIFCQLTPTILRASQAVGTGLGVFRTFLR